MNRLFILCLGLVILFQLALPIELESSCVSCHEKEAAIYEDSVHRRSDIGCTDCHGGNPDASKKETAKTPETGYRGVIDKFSIPELCGSCHSDVRLMNPYELPTDQLDQYRYSHHGQALFERGDKDVATCVDCHQSHGIHGPRDPRSSVYPKNIPATCGRCHSDSDKMSSHGLDSDQEELYRQSIHAEMLFEKDDLSAPTCVTCHGNHGAVPPGITKVANICGKCHITPKKFFNLGPHAEPARKGNFDTCVTCHSNHKIRPVSDKLFKVCMLCHEKGDWSYTVIKEIYSLLKNPHKRFDEVMEEVKEASRAGLETEEEFLLMEEARTYLKQLLPMQHSADMGKLRKLSDQIEVVLVDVESRIDKKEKSAKRRKNALIPISYFLFIMSFLFWLKWREVEGRRK